MKVVQYKQILVSMSAVISIIISQDHSPLLDKSYPFNHLCKSGLNAFISKTGLKIMYTISSSRLRCILKPFDQHLISQFAWLRLDNAGPPFFGPGLLTMVKCALISFVLG